MGKIKEIILDDGLRILPRPDYISYEQIQECLTKAHSTNLKTGLVYSTASQSVEKLKEKLINAETFVVLNSNDSVVATASIQFRTINHWYCQGGEIGLQKLDGVLPEYAGKGIGQLLMWVRKIAAMEHNVKLIVTDSAEDNIAVKKLALKNGFKTVDCCKYPNNNFVSSVYAFWFDGCPFTDEEILTHYSEHRKKIVNVL